ncbi:MAG: hypothetical protein EXS40_09945 [Opitutaceae bacterium]|nr:hypothetical protein [Opitutaceae bacterium]
MSKKNDLAPPISGWGEVILGAALSVVLGAVLGALALGLKPTVIVKEPPKEPVAGVTDFIEGSRETNKGKQAAVKRKHFTQWATGFFSISEEELNALVVSAKPAAVPAAAAAKDFFTAGTLNFRIRTGGVRIGLPVTISALGALWRVVLQAQGRFAKKGHAYVFEPETVLVGSCPVQRLPYASTYVTKKFLSSQPLNEDIAAVWPKLASLTVDGSTLKLTMS